MEKILITGFTRFGHYRENTTEILKKYLPELGKYSVEYLIFPVIIFGPAEKYGEEIVAKAKEINARAIISLGMASDVHGVRIESRAINWVENKKYCLPEEHKKIIDGDAFPKDFLCADLSKWDMDCIFSNFHARKLEHEPKISYTAGTFCCNALMWRTLSAINAARYAIPYIFLHLPCTLSASRGVPGFSKKNHLTSVHQAREILAIFAISF